MYAGQRNYPQAETNYARSLKLTEQFYGPEQYATAHLLQAYGVMLTACGRHAEAEAALQHALKIYERVVVAGHPLIVDIQKDLALLHKGKGAKAAGVEKRAALKNPKQV